MFNRRDLNVGSSINYRSELLKERSFKFWCLYKLQVGLYVKKILIDEEI